MKLFLKTIAVIIVTLGLMLIVSLLFAIPFIQQHILRQLVIWLLEAVILFVGFRLVQALQQK